MIPPLSHDLLSRLSGLATAEFGLRFPPDRWNELARGVASAALELGIPDLEGWAENLVQGSPAADHLKAVANHLTISETYFFRQRETFHALENEILPARLAVRREQGRPLRIWSAGCASGEEPYSIAILLRQKFPDLRQDNIVIHATDINSHVLARAQRGIYSEWSFRDVPDWVKGSYFTRKPNGRHEISPEIRRMVRFSQLNFAAPIYPAEFGDRGDFDVILCRNVLMYFSADWQERIVRRFAAALAPDGWLIVGPCDLTAALSADLHLRLAGPGVFQKTDRRVPLPVPELPLPTPVHEPLLWPVASGPAVAIEAPPPPEPPALVPPAPALTPAATESEVASALAHSHANRGELEQALAACEEAIALDKTNPNFHYLRACILQEQDRLPEAAAAYRRVLFLDPRSVMAEFALGCIAERQGRRDQARHHFGVVLRMLGGGNRGDAVPGSEGLTVGRLRAVVESSLAGDAA
jgi:chemotaxis protein methyltransferase CheR